MSTVHIFTVASDESKLARLYASAECAGVRVNLIPIVHWTGYVDKIFAMNEVLSCIPDDDLVCFIDAYDVLAWGGVEEIVAKFRAYNCQVLMSSELNCYPAENRARYTETDQYVSEYAMKTPQSHYRYLNSGGYLGTCRAIRRMLAWKSPDEMRDLCSRGGDQNYFTEYYLAWAGDPDVGIRLDDQQAIFQSMYKVDLACFGFYGGRILNQVMGQSPCFLHFNGYRDYGEQVVNVHTGARVDAMDAFHGVQKKMRLDPYQYRYFNCGYKVPDFYYGGVLQGPLPQI